MNGPDDAPGALELLGLAREAAALRAQDPSQACAPHAIFLAVVFRAKAPDTELGGRLARELCVAALLAWGRSKGVPVAQPPPGGNVTTLTCAPSGCICVSCELNHLREHGFGGISEMLCEGGANRETLERARLSCRTLPPDLAQLGHHAAATVERLAVHCGLDLEEIGPVEKGSS